MAKKKSNIIVSTLVLVAITFVAILALAVVNQITLQPIADADASLKNQAYAVVYPGSDGKITEIDDVDKLIDESKSLLDDNGLEGCAITNALAVKGSGSDIEGYIIAAKSPNGYGGDIEVAIGICDDKLTGYTALSNNETAGLGSKCTEPEFADQFAGKQALFLSFTKTGSASDTEIDAISGATITTNAVTQAVNAAIIFYQENFGGGVQEIEGPDLTEFYQAAYPDGESFEDVENAKELIADSVDLLEQYGLTNCAIAEVKSVNGGEGYVISSTGVGFAKASPIQIAIGFKDGVITGYSVISHMETQGYGAACASDEFASQFAGKPAVIMSSSSSASEDNEIDAISGATFTTNGVTNAVNSAIIFYQTHFGDGEIDTEALSSNSTADTSSSATPSASTTTEATTEADVSSSATPSASSNGNKGKGGH